MRSNEFGDISIRTAVTPDNISAQISLSHDDLAKTLTAHLPDVQAKVGITTGFEITVHASDRSSGTASSMNDTGAGSQGSRQQEQSGHPYSSRFSVTSVTDQGFPAAVLAGTAHPRIHDGRIDLQA